MRGKITKRAVDAMKPGPSDVMLWDSELPGFGCKLTPAGRRVFLLQYWAPKRAGVRRRLTFGEPGRPVVRLYRGAETTRALTPDVAREMAADALAAIRGGADPAAVEQEERVGAKVRTVATLSVDYLADVRAKLKERSADEYERIFEKNLLPSLGKIPVARVTVRDVDALHRALRKTPTQANRCVQILSAFLNWCAIRGLRPRGDNPCRAVQLYPEHARERFLSEAELARLGDAFRLAETVGLAPAPEHRRRPKSEATARHRPKSADTPRPANPVAVAVLRFLALTGWREQEALTLRWDALDFARGYATLANTKTGKSQRPLGAPALELLAERPRHADSPYVFPGKDSAAPLREIKRVWAAARHAAKLPEVRLHDLRHTVASVAVASGQSLYMTGLLLGHTRVATTERYAHLADDARRQTADTVSLAVHAAMSERDPKVTPITRRHGAPRPRARSGGRARR